MCGENPDAGKDRHMNVQSEKGETRGEKGERVGKISIVIVQQREGGRETERERTRQEYV